MKSQTPKATDTRCPRQIIRDSPCFSDLVRTEDGADRISELNGRIVLMCCRCKTRWTIPVESAEFSRKVPKPLRG